jgi:hypothetical protein
MNLGFYLETNGGTPQNTEIYKFINQEVEAGSLRDAAVFFNSVNYNATPVKCGMFDAAHLWSFTGNLIATSVLNVIKAKSIANKLKLGYLYSGSDKAENTIFEIVRISKTMPVCVRNILDYREFERITGKQPTLIEEFSLTAIKDLFDGRH